MVCTRSPKAGLISWALIALGLACLVAAQQPVAGREDKDKSARIKLPQWRFVNLFAGVADARGVDESAAARDIKQQFAAAGDGKNLRALGELFKQHHFSVVEKVAKNKKLSDVEADGLARMRRQMINHAMALTIQALDPSKQLTIGMLDSGNKNSGIASDVDQTVFVIPKDKAAELKIDENAVIKEFNAKFEKAFGVHPERLGIESLNGADFFPDWRQAHSLDKVGTSANDLGKEASSFMKEADRVVNEKRKNPEAYRSEGQLKSQAEGRGYEALQEHSQRMRDLREANDRIEEHKANADLSEGDRKTKIAEVEQALLKKHAKNYPAGSIAELEQKFNKDSPWTEVGFDEKGNPLASQLEDPAAKVLANKPEFHERFAFDGAWDNWIMYEHHPHNRRKYLLRSIAEGISLMRDRGGRPLSTFEYEKVYAKNTDASHAELKAFIDESYRDLSDSMRELFKKTLDVAAKERLRHKGVKNPSTGQDYTTKEVFSEFWPAMSEAEARMYGDMPKEAVEKMLQERAIRRWESVGREIMIENLVRTVKSPAAMLRSPMSDAEFKRIQEKFPDATRAKLTKAVERQLYHGIHDLITIEHARELVASPERRKSLKPRTTDLLDRMIQKLGGAESELGREVLRVAKLAAYKRVSTEPGERAFRQEVYSYMRDSVKESLNEKIAQFEEAKQRARQFYDDYKSGKVTGETVARHLVAASAERLTSLRVQAGNALGYDITKATLLIPDNGWPKVELEYGRQGWSGRQFMSNIATAGNVDSVLTVMLAYQEGGKEAAAWAAGYELIMNVPAIAHANAIKELVVDHRPQGIVMLGSAMAVPVLGQAYIFINIGKTSVMLLGHAVLDPLKDDDADKMYQGFLDQRSGFTEVARSQRPSLLHHVPIRVIPREVEGEDGEKVMTVVWRRYSSPEADRLFNVLDEKEYNKLVEAEILGGGEEWDKAAAQAGDEIADPQLHFQAKRASMHYHFGDAVKAKLAAKNLDPDDDEAMPLIAEYFMGYIDEWVNAKGAFAGFDENVIISRRFEDQALRQKIAYRAAGDFVYSYKLIRGSVIETTTIERNTEARIAQFRARQIAEDANAMIVGIDRALKQDVELDLAHAIDQEMNRRKEEARIRSPRFHAWPRITAEDNANADSSAEQRQNIEFIISVLDGPEPLQPSPADKDYKTEVRYELEPLSVDEVQVTAYVKVTGLQTGQAIPPYVPPAYENFTATPRKELAIKLGTMARAGSMPHSSDLKVAYRLKDAAAQTKAAAQVAVASAATSDQPPAKRPKDQTTTDGALLYEDFNGSKAAPRADLWAGKEVASLTGQAWVCWEKAPLEVYYVYEITVTGGAQKYQKANSGPTGARDRFPDQKNPSGRANVFVMPFDWPEGNVGSFAMKGAIYAFSKPPGDAWKTATPLDKVEFNHAFLIPDQRKAADADLVVKYSRRMNAAEIAAAPGLSPQDKERYSKYAQSGGGTTNVPIIEPFDSSKADLWGRNWGDLPPGSASGFTPQMQVRWKDAPPNAQYFFEVAIKGGAPALDEKKAGGIYPTDEFPPAPYKSGPGSNAFVVDIPSPMNRGGAFDITGKLIALPKGNYSGDAWKQAKPLGEFPFQARMELKNRSRYAQGTIRVGEDSSASMMVLLAYVQQGRRVVKVEAGGKTIHQLLDQNYYNGGYFPGKPYASHWVNVNLPHGSQGAGSANVSFMDFGQMVTMTVPLKPEGDRGDPARRAASLAEYDGRTLKQIEDMSKNQEANLDPLARAYQDLASHCFTTDYGKWKEYAGKSMEYWSRNYAKDLPGAKDDNRRNQVLQNIIGSADMLYGGAVAWGNAGEAMGEFQTVVGKIQGSGLPAGIINGRLSGLYGAHAENIVRLTGDLNAAHAAWLKSQELSKGASGVILFTNSGAPPKSPYELDPSFQTP